MKEWIAGFVLVNAFIIGYGLCCGIDAALEAYKALVFLTLGAIVVATVAKWVQK